MTIKPRKQFAQHLLQGYRDSSLQLPPNSWFTEGAYLIQRGFSPVSDGFVRCVATEGVDGENLFAEVVMATGKVRMCDLGELKTCFLEPTIILTEDERELFLAEAGVGAVPYPLEDFSASNPVGKEEVARPVSDNFYLVWSLHKGTPTKRQPSRDAAEQEAARLAEKHPGVEFFVVEAISRVKGLVSVSLEQLA